MLIRLLSNKYFEIPYGTIGYIQKTKTIFKPISTLESLNNPSYKDFGSIVHIVRFTNGIVLCIDPSDCELIQEIS